MNGFKQNVSSWVANRHQCVCQNFDLYVGWNIHRMFTEEGWG